MTESNGTPVTHGEAGLTLNPADPADMELADFGERILRLLKSPQAQRSHFFVATLDDFLGALYALVFSQHNDHPFQTRSGPIEVRTVVRRAEDITQGKLRISGNWLAGFHFNSAIFRIAACYHRGLKVVSNKEASKLWKHQLLPDVQTNFPTWQYVNLDKVYDEVNDLKHTAEGTFNSRSVSRAEAVSSVAELLELFELWTKTQPSQGHSASSPNP